MSKRGLAEQAKRELYAGERERPVADADPYVLDRLGRPVKWSVVENRRHFYQADAEWRFQCWFRQRQYELALSGADGGKWAALVASHRATPCFHCELPCEEDFAVYPVQLLSEAVIQQCCVACLSGNLRFQAFDHDLAVTFLWDGLSVGSYKRRRYPQLMKTRSLR